jgi:hypothetical protein
MASLFVDQAYKLDIRSLVADAGKRGANQVLRHPIPLWLESGRPWEERPDNHLTARVVLAQDDQADPARGQGTLNFVQADGRKSEQMLLLRGVRSKNGRLGWRAVCPLTKQLVQTLYLSPNEQQFMSRDAAQLTNRRFSRSKLGRHIDRSEAILRELCATHNAPGIYKPSWMTEARYDELMQKLGRLDVARRHAIAGLGEPDFGDMDVAPEILDAPPQEVLEPDEVPFAEPLRVNNPESASMYYRDKHGTLQMKAECKRKYGLPEGA